MSPDPRLSASLESLLAAGVERKAAPGLAAVAFNRDGIFAQAATGDDGTGRPLSLDTIVWIASSGKLPVSLLTLIACEDKGFDIDSHEKLVKICPELGKDYDGKVYTLFDGKDENGEWKFRKAAESAPGLTVRHLLNHTSGWGYFFSSEEGAWPMTQPGGSALGSDAYLNCPRVWEVDEKWGYNMGCDWLAPFIARLTGLTLRDAFKKYLFSPLGLEPDTIDTFRTPAMDAKRGAILARNEKGDWVPLPEPFDTPQYEGVPPQGENPLTSAPIWCDLLAFTKIIQPLLNEEGLKNVKSGQPLLSKSIWEQAIADDLAKSGKSAEQRPFSESSIPHLASPLEYWMKPKKIKAGSKHPLGWSLLQTTVFREESATELKAGTLSWSGLANTYYFVDREQGIGGVVSTQIFPWATSAMIELRDSFERWVVDNKP